MSALGASGASSTRRSKVPRLRIDPAAVQLATSVWDYVDTNVT